jgi:hypothetical protein
MLLLSSSPMSCTADEKAVTVHLIACDKPQGIVGKAGPLA